MYMLASPNLEQSPDTPKERAMNLRLRSEGFRITGALDDFVRLRLRRALGRFRDCIDRVAVSMRDENGPRGGVDKRVALQIGLRGLRPVTVEARAVDLYDAIGRGSQRAERQVARLLDRQRTIRRR